MPIPIVMEADIRAVEFNNYMPIEQAFPLDQAPEAQRISQAGHVRGKLVLIVDRGSAAVGETGLAGVR